MGTSLFTLEEMLEVVNPRVLAGEVTASVRAPIKRLWTDSRTVRRGDCFVALQGERFDGHAFVPEVFRKGATVALVNDTYPVPADLLQRGHARRPALILGVRDTLAAFQRLATHHRQRFRIPVVAVTGSNGKTTTKEMTASVLGTRWTTLKTEGNLNNRIGVPQMLLRLTPRHKAAVIEMGVDARGQTTRLCEMVKPTLGIITNIGADHLEFFGDLEGSAQAKAELLDMMPPDGVVALNADDAYFDYLAARAPGVSLPSAFRLARMCARPTSTIEASRARPSSCTFRDVFVRRAWRCGFMARITSSTLWRRPPSGVRSG